MKKMKIVHIASFESGHFSGVKSVLEELIPAQRALGYEIKVFNNKHNIQKVIDGEIYIAGYRDFVKYIKEIQPDLVLFHTIYDFNKVKYSYYLRYKKIPYIIEPHGSTTSKNTQKSKIKKKIANSIYVKCFIQHSKGLIYLNKKEKDDCIFYKLKKRFAIVPNGTQLHDIENKERNDSAVKFIFLGRIDIIPKGLDLLFPAIKLFNTKYKPNLAEFHFYGQLRDPNMDKVFENYIKDAGNNVFYHGPVSGQDKEQAYRNSNVFVLTSRGEGMPMSVLEALSYGLPCLLSPQTNMASLITENNCGWVTETSVDVICDDIYKAVTDYNDNTDELIRNSLTAVESFSWDCIAKDSIKAYLDMMQA